MSTKPDHVVIAGAGIVGVSTAYFLAKEHKISKITLIDPTGTIAPAASGKAAGFLALDWRDGTPLEKLARRSFRLHQELAEVFGHDKIQYRRVSSCAFVEVLTNNRPNKKRRITKGQRESLEWADIDKTKSIELVGDEESLAQVHPMMLCEAMWEATTKMATTCELLQGKAVGVEHNDGKLVSVLLDNNKVIKGDAFLVSAGPWSADIIKGSKANSVVFRTKTVGKQVVFLTKGQDSFEGFVRPDQTMFCSGYCEDEVKVTEEPGKEKVTQGIAEQIVSGIQDAAMDGYVMDTDMIRACYQPTTPDGLPMMGSIPDLSQCFIAVGHDCWGILMGPASGEVMSNLIVTGKTNNGHVNLKPFKPTRFGTFKLFGEE